MGACRWHAQMMATEFTSLAARRIDVRGLKTRNHHVCM